MEHSVLIFKKGKLKKTLKYRTFKFLFIEFGISDKVFGICLFDKYCYTSEFGWEILK